MTAQSTAQCQCARDALRRRIRGLTRTCDLAIGRTSQHTPCEVSSRTYTTAHLAPPTGGPLDCEVEAPTGAGGCAKRGPSGNGAPLAKRIGPAHFDRSGRVPTTPAPAHARRSPQHGAQGESRPPDSESSEALVAAGQRPLVNAMSTPRRLPGTAPTSQPSAVDLAPAGTVSRRCEIPPGIARNRPPAAIGSAA
jgi:hypothetical protein